MYFSCTKRDQKKANYLIGFRAVTASNIQQYTSISENYHFRLDSNSDIFHMKDENDFRIHCSMNKRKYYRKLVQLQSNESGGLLSLVNDEWMQINKSLKCYRST